MHHNTCYASAKASQNVSQRPQSDLKRAQRRAAEQLPPRSRRQSDPSGENTSQQSADNLRPARRTVRAPRRRARARRGADRVSGLVPDAARRRTCGQRPSLSQTLDEYSETKTASASDRWRRPLPGRFGFVFLRPGRFVFLRPGRHRFFAAGTASFSCGRDDIVFYGRDDIVFLRPARYRFFTAGTTSFYGQDGLLFTAQDGLRFTTVRSARPTRGFRARVTASNASTVSSVAVAHARSQQAFLSHSCDAGGAHVCEQHRRSDVQHVGPGPARARTS